VQCESSDRLQTSSRRLMIRTIFESCGCTRGDAGVSANPARGKAQGRNDPRRCQFARANGAAEMDRKPGESQKPKSRHPKIHSPFAKCSHFIYPPRSRGAFPLRRARKRIIRRKPIGSDDTIKRARGTGDAEMHLHPLAGANLRRVSNPMSATGRKQKGRTSRPARPRKLERSRVAERRA